MNKTNFSREQMQAINHFRGPALIIAGPGSGKTTVIVNRIINLIDQRDIKPEEILVITFSKMAAISMQSRFNSVYHSCRVTFGTFHSVFYNIVRQQNPRNNFKIANRNVKHSILIKVLDNIDFNDNLEPEFLDSVIKRISYYKNSDKKTDNAELCNISDELFMRLFKMYDEILHFEGYIDFEDMMLMCKELLASNADVRRKYSELFRFILIDEFQDINYLQYEIIKLLTGNERNIFVVGDDDQAIYGFRGSKPQIMQEFEQEYSAQLIRMTCNYRSTGQIIDSAGRLISNNIERYEKNIYTINHQGQPVIIKGFAGKEEEKLYLCDSIKAKAGKCSIAVLLRNNIAVAEYVSLLLAGGIKCKTVEVMENPFESWIFKDFWHYINMAYDMDNIDIRDFVAVMNRPVRYISRDSIVGRRVDLTLLKGLNKDRNYVLKELTRLEQDLIQLKKMDMFSAFYYFRNIIGYESFVAKEAMGNQTKIKKQLDTMDQIQNMLRNIYTRDSLKDAVINMDNVKKDKEEMRIEGNIYVMTYHASKGLEFDSVYLPNLMEGEVPSSKNTGDAAIEEERRMFYVAMTRAKKELTLTYLNDNKYNKVLISRFVREILPDCKTN